MNENQVRIFTEETFKLLCNYATNLDKQDFIKMVEENSDLRMIIDTIIELKYV